MITGFGRLGAPFGAQYFDVMPDIITAAKGLTNGAVPMGAVFVRKHIYDAFMKGPESAIELFHGYTYSAHPGRVRGGTCDAGDLRARRSADARRAAREDTGKTRCIRCAMLPNVIDIRNLGLVAGIELQPRAGAPGARAYEVS